MTTKHPTEMESCTSFCQKLRGVADKSCPPSREVLVAQLQASDTELASGWSLGTWADLQKHQCPFCQLAVSAILENFTDPTSIDPNQSIGVSLFPEENAFRLSYPSRLGTTLAFAAGHDGQVTSPDNARPLTESALLPSIISDWLRKCDENHGDCLSHSLSCPSCGDMGSATDEDKPSCYFFGEELTSNFRVIDLKERCIRSAALHVRYVTLSYVWGRIPMFRLRRSNLKELSKPGGLNKIWSSLPKTIVDSINLVRRLGERYLWIDALCLVQDNPADMSLGIELMSSIYKGSYFTLVVATGDDGNAGIPSYTESQRIRSDTVRELTPGGLGMTILHSIDWHLERSTYSQRGWTLQELVLPQRTIIFINNQVYFRCRKANWSEETWADKWESWLDPDDSNISRLPGLHDEKLWFFWTYQKLCEDYSRRKLSNDGDALCAISGICRPLFGGMGTYGVEGLPKRFLHAFLLFISSNGNLSRRPEFASFSWAGWEGKIMWPRENYVWYENGQGLWDMENMTKWLRKNRLVKWCVIKTEDDLLNSEPVDIKVTKNFRKLVKEYPFLLKTDDVEDPGLSKSLANLTHGSSDEDDDLFDKPFRRSYALSLSQSHIDYEHLINRYFGYEDTRMNYMLRNCMASRRYSESPHARMRNLTN